jgi:type I restriction enzyme R subunit
VNKKELTETDIRSKFITPAICGGDTPKWDTVSQVREEVYFTKGRVIVRGKSVTRGQARKADYILYYKPNIPIAVVEAKDNTQAMGAGMQQALSYAEALDIPFVYSSNGDGFLEHDRTVTKGPSERELALHEFPTPEELWMRWATSKGLSNEEQLVVSQDFYDDGLGRTPRYYQLTAINRTVQAVAKGEKRVLLVMATGTGKTYTAFQIIWRLWKAGVKKRILFLVDRNILADQTKANDFKPFGSAMTKITNRTIDKSYEIYLSLYQAVTGNEEAANIYKQFSPNFFDLIIVDECHRGSAADDAAWREILEYFQLATQIGLTATPKETKDVSNIEYFGEPIYTYSLKQGIEDGFLAPYKVVRIGLDKDLEGWRPEAGQTDKYGNEIEDREYNAMDFDRSLVLEKRTVTVAKKITQFLRATDRFAKTIVFCENIDHADRMRQALVNENPDLAGANSKYVMKITGDDNEGKGQLDNFIDPESTFPVIATTSKLLTTGVDAQTCRLIVLDKRIASMTEFKQIIGRGTRINEEYNKLYFTIMDFRQATALFADPAFDGDPVQVYEPGPDDPPEPPDDERPPWGERPNWSDPQVAEERTTYDEDLGEKPKKFFVDNVSVTVISERVQYLDASGKLITESLNDYTRKTIASHYASLDAFLLAWNGAGRKQQIIDALAAQGVFLDELAKLVGKEFDAFDLVCHVAFDQPPLTRKERADRVRKNDVFAKYGPKARAVLDALLDKYTDSGVKSVESMDILKVAPLPKYGTPLEIVGFFGGKVGYLAAVHELSTNLYASYSAS